MTEKIVIPIDVSGWSAMQKTARTIESQLRFYLWGFPVPQFTVGVLSNSICITIVASRDPIEIYTFIFKPLLEYNPVWTVLPSGRHSVRISHRGLKEIIL